MSRSELCMVLCLLCAAASAQTILPVPDLPEINAGQHVTIHMDVLPTQGAQVYLRRGDEKSPEKGIPISASVDQPAKGLTFLVPAGTPPARYLVYAVVGDKELQVPGELHVLPE